MVSGWLQCGQLRVEVGVRASAPADVDARGSCLLFAEADGPVFIAGLVALFLGIAFVAQSF